MLYIIPPSTSVKKEAYGSIARKSAFKLEWNKPGFKTQLCHLLTMRLLWTIYTSLYWRNNRTFRETRWDQMIQWWRKLITGSSTDQCSHLLAKREIEKEAHDMMPRHSLLILHTTWFNQQLFPWGIFKFPKWSSPGWVARNLQKVRRPWACFWTTLTSVSNSGVLSQLEPTRN